MLNWRQSPVCDVVGPPHRFDSRRWSPSSQNVARLLIGDFILIVFAELAAVPRVRGGVGGAMALQLRRCAVHRVERDRV